MDNLLYFIVLLPLLGFLFNGLIGKFLPQKMVGAIATSVVFGAFLLSLNLFFNIETHSPAQIFTLFEWFSVGNFSVDFAFQLDQLSILMILLITGVGSLIHLYSIGYMADDKGLSRFFAYLNLFIFFMLMLVLGSNYLMLFIGWEGVGLCSFLLIGFWYQNLDYGKAARKAFIMNRIGDLGLLIGIFALATEFQSLDYLSVQSKIIDLEDINLDLILLITIGFFVGAMGKSAQIPLFTWLPDAMAGPTPVSALIHAATMVTAGIYLIVRSNFLYDLVPFTQDFILWIGLITSLISAFIALRQDDIKKVLAYSTISQLGFMFMALGVGAYTTAIFHMLTHAFFKALLFLGAGSVIHAMGGEQNMLKMGGLRAKIPITFWTFLVGTLAICGVPPLSGMISKDEILMVLYAKNPMLWGLAMLSAGLTATYMLRLLFLTFFGEFRGTPEQEKHLHESPWVMLLPLVILSILAILGGVLNLPHFIAHGEYQFLSQWLDNVLVLPSVVPEISFVEEVVLLFSTLLMIGGVFVWSKKKYLEKNYQEEKIFGWQKLSQNKLYIDEIYQFFIIKPIEFLAKLLSVFDKNILDNNNERLGDFTTKMALIIRKMQNGKVETYLLIMTFVMGVLMILVKFL